MGSSFFFLLGPGKCFTRVKAEIANSDCRTGGRPIDTNKGEHSRGNMPFGRLGASDEMPVLRCLNLLPFLPEACFRKSNRTAFSLVELLVVIAVIAVIAAISIPNVSNITAAAQSASKLRNAETVSLIYNSYLACHQASVGTSVAPYGTKESAVAAIIAPGGLSVTNAKLGTTNTFRVPVTSTNDIAMDQLTMSYDQLVFVNPS